MILGLLAIKGVFMIDWNNDGNIGVDDIILTDIILEDDEKRGAGNKPNGNCLNSVLIFIIPMVVVAFLVVQGMA